MNRRHVLSATALGATTLALLGAGSAQAVTLKVNFQPTTAPVPAGYSVDGGLAYASGRGFGWVQESSLSSATHVGLDISERARDRNAVSDQRLDTLIHLNDIKNTGRGAGAWEATLPNDSYVVTIAAGDPSAFDSTHRVQVEGTTAIDFAATTSLRQRTATVTVSVTDGRLTLDGIGGVNTKLQYVDIATATTPPPLSRKFNFAPGSTPAVGGYTKDTGESFTAARGHGWVTRASLTSATHTPLSVTGNARDRNLVADQRVDSFIHMQLRGGSGVTTPAAWELAVADGTYEVTFGVGDWASFDSDHELTIEGTRALDSFVPSALSRTRTISTTVTVADGRLTVDPGTGNDNTKLAWLTVDSTSAIERPTFATVDPDEGTTDVLRDRAITSEVRLIGSADGVSPTSLSSSTVRLERVSDGALVSDARVTTSGGFDVVVVQPPTALAANTEYRLLLTSGVTTLSGVPFRPKASTFTTGTRTSGSSTIASFTKTAQASSAGELSASIAMGPDDRLYATTLDGKIMRYPVAADGSLGTPTTINTVINHEGGARHILGLVFDPESTPSAPVLWITSSSPEFANAPDWTGKISRLSGANLSNITDYVTNLPRSVQDHETNSIEFGPDGALYVTQGSNTAMGRADLPWGLRPERALTGAVLRINQNAITIPPLNARTAEGGTYDPLAPGAPVKVWASGVRNAYDLVWHTNGQMYVPVNGSAGGGNTPATPSPLPSSCNQRIDSATRGAWTGPSVPALSGVEDQDDLLLRVVQNGYYGHPNPIRCEWTFFGGNPTSGPDLLDTPLYPVGTPPDRNFRHPTWNFGLHYSPNGAIEYRGGAFNAALRGRLLVTRYSAGDDVVALDLDPTTHEVTDQEQPIPGLTGFVDPLDVIEDTRNGNLYVTELGAQRISLAKPNTGG